MPSQHHLGAGTLVPPAMSTPVLLDTAHLHSSLIDPALTSMTLLNEIAGRYPEAISFAAGRPYEGYYDVQDLHRYLRGFQRYLEQAGCSEEQVRRTFFQYGRTKGFIHELIGRHLELDEGISVDPESLVVTTGVQEGLNLVLRALYSGPRDVVLAATPNYVGFIGAARMVGMRIRPVCEGAEGIDLDDLAVQIDAVVAEGLRPRAVYVVPDFANPRGVSMPGHRRRQLLDLAARSGVLILEDNPYSILDVADERPMTLKAMDRDSRVVYFGSFAKSAFAGARVAYVVADQLVVEAGRPAGMFADQLSKLKSMSTLNTSTVAQAVIGGFLLEHDCSLRKATRREAQVYRRNLDAVLDGLERRFPGGAVDPDAPVRWNVPSGGMFLVVTVPFRADEAALERSARDHGLLWTPMYHFYEGGRGADQLRMSFSVLTEEQIYEGLDRLVDLVADLGRPSQTAAAR